MRWTINQALAHWRSEGLINAQKEKELRHSLEDAEDTVPSRAIAAFSAVGAILVGLGVILFVASNWAELGPTFKTALLVIAMLGTGWAGYHLAFERGTYQKTGMGLLFINVMIFGATIFLVAQIYHLPLNFWWGMTLWFLGTAFMAYILQSRLHIALSMILMILALGWFRAQYVRGFDEIGSLFDPEVNLLGMLPAVGVFLIALAVLHRKSPRLEFAEGSLFHGGMFFLLLPLIISTAAREAYLVIMRYPMDLVGYVGLALAVGAVGCAMAFGEFRTKQGKWALLALPLYLLFAFIIAHIPTWMGITQESLYYANDNFWVLSALHVLHILLVFIFLLIIVWEGTLLRMEGLVNLGIVGIGITVIIQYFSWVFELLDRSIAFILGGLVILGASALLERKRRALLASINAR